MNRRKFIVGAVAAPIAISGAVRTLVDAELSWSYPPQFVASTGHRFILGKLVSTGEVGPYISWSDPDGSWDIQSYNQAGAIYLPHYLCPDTQITEERGVINIRYKDRYAYNVIYNGQPFIFSFYRA